MKKIRIAFYKWKKTFFSKIIYWKQKRLFPKKYAKYTHTELVFWSNSFSSSEVDGWTRIKQIDYKKKNWDFIDIELSNEKYQDILWFCMSKVWKEYWWWAIFFAQTLNFNCKWPDTYFCSEICCEWLQQAKILCGVSALFVEPAELCFRLEQEWYNITN